MNLRNPSIHPARQAMLAALALGALPGFALAAEADDARRLRDIEMRLEQEEAQRQIEARERTQQQALQAQQDSIRQLEQARQRLDQNAREVAELSTRLGRDITYRYSGTYSAPYGAGEAPRAVLGVSLGDTQSRDGAVIRSVSPGGAAAEAGLRAGDVITHLGGVAVGKDSNPERAVVEKMLQVEPDTKVPVTVLRAGRKMDFEVTARAAPRPQIEPLPPLAGGRPLQLQLRGIGDAPQGGGEPAAYRRLLELQEGNRLGGMEFATVSAGLGSYFGVEEGVLVIRAGADAPFTLQDGDVILAIDGREPTNAQHAGRILRSYQPGEPVKLRVQRNRRAMDIETKAPGHPD